MTEIQNPNLYASFQQGAEFGTKVYDRNKLLQDKNKLSQLSSGVLAGDPMAYAQAVAIDPKAAGDMDEAHVKLAKRAAGYANYVLTKFRRGASQQEMDAAMRDGQQFMSSTSGQPFPTTFDPAMVPHMETLVATASQLSDPKGMPNSYEEYQLAQQNPEYGKFLAGQQPTQMVTLQVPGGTLQGQWNPRTHTLTDMAGNQINQDGSPMPGQQGGPQAAAQPPAAAPLPQGDPPQTEQIDGTILPGANVPPGDEAAIATAAAAPPGTIVKTQPNGGINVTQPGSAQVAPPAPRIGFKPDKVEPGVIAKRTQELQDLRSAGQQITEADATAYLKDGKFPDSQKDGWRDMTPDEARARGLPTGTVAQIGPNGKIEIVNKPRDLPTGGQVIDNGDGTTTYIPAGKLSDGQRNAAGFYARMVNSDQELQALEAKGYDPTNLRDYATVGGQYLNGLASSEGQQYHQAAQNWVRANLRKESGAAIGVAEMDQEIKNYFPQYGDGADVIKQKAHNRQILEQAMRTSAGGAIEPPSNTKPAPHPTVGWSVKRVN